MKKGKSTLRHVRVGDTRLNEALVPEGMTCLFTRYSDRPICQGCKALADKARKARRGLWSMPKPVAPWEFRRRQRRN